MWERWEERGEARGNFEMRNELWKRWESGQRDREKYGYRVRVRNDWIVGEKQRSIWNQTHQGSHWQLIPEVI